MIFQWLFGSAQRKVTEGEGRSSARAQLGAELSGSCALDDDGQPTIRGYNESRRLDRAINELMGFLKATLIDGKVDEPEVEALAKWLLKNRELQQIWPVNVITERVAHVLRDGIADEQERAELMELFEKLTGPEPDRFINSRMATRLPLTAPPPPVEFLDRTFVLTGKFLYGTRKVCEQAILQRGGLCEPRVTLRSNFLVIGVLGSEDWIHSSHGRKIEQAVALASEGRPIAIIAEEHWERFIMA